MIRSKQTNYFECLRPKPLLFTANIKQKVEDIIGLNRSRNREKNSQYNDEKTTDKGRHNSLQDNV